MQPLCFVLMPFGIKTDGNKKEINFDTVYNSFIKPAIIKANLVPIRADEEKDGGFIHKPMYERLLFCSFAVADLSFDNANVFYELGIRHAVKSYTTVCIFEKNTKLSFDVAPLRTFPYEFTDGKIVDAEQQTAALAKLIEINLGEQMAQEDSPIGQLITTYQFPDLTYLQEDAASFANWVTSTNASKDAMRLQVKNWKQSGKDKNAPAQKSSIENVKAIETAEGTGLKYNFNLLHVLLDSYKSMDAFEEIARMLAPVIKRAETPSLYLQQQLALAYNKIKQREDAEKILLGIINKYGNDPETNGLLGAVYKGMMDDNKEDNLMKQEYLGKAVEAYLDGFEADPRDHYPGVNALMLMFLSQQPDERFARFMPLVGYAVERQLPNKPKDYWVQASALDLAVLEMNAAKANQYLAKALFCNPDSWMINTTADDLQKIYDKAVQTKTAADMIWLQEIIKRLRQIFSAQ